MVKKTITYVDFDGNTQSEDHWFHLSKAELMKLKVKMDGHYIDYIQSCIANKKVEGIFDFFYELLLDAHGERTDSNHFRKSPESRKDFEDSIAFSEILNLYMSDGDFMSTFTRALLPPDFQETLPSNEQLVEALPASN